MIKIIDLCTMEQRALHEREATVLCLGNFDGVHLAHATLVHKARELGERLLRTLGSDIKVSCGAFFFSDHPSGRLSGGRSARLTSLEDKLELFRDMGLEIAVVAEFDALMNMAPEEFVHGVLHGLCGAVGAVCGYNFRFGKGGKGDAKRLCELFGDGRCEVVDEVTVAGEAVSSSAIRAALRFGDVEGAAKMLGRKFSILADIKKEGASAFARIPREMAVPCEARYEVELEMDGGSLMAECVTKRVVDETECEISGADVRSGRVKIAFIRKI